MIDENPLYSLEAVIAEQYPDYTIQENIARYLKEIKTGGLNLFEIQIILICLVIIRLIYYSVRYNPITSIKLCSIGAVSCYFWWVVLNDCVKGYYTSMECQSLLMRMHYEQDIFRDTLEDRLETKWQIIKLKRLIRGEKVERRSLQETVRIVFDWTFDKVVFKILPFIPFSPLVQLINFAYNKVSNNWIMFYQAVEGFFVGLYPFALYTFFVRQQKRFIPYHVRWHYTFIIITNPYFNYFATCMARAQIFIAETLIPRNRLVEAQELEVMLGCFALTHIACVTTAMLHALFNQYFYIPLFSFTTELHIGKRPKESFYSGGYTAWQDHWNFWDAASYRSALRLWWGWLGRGVLNEDKEGRKEVRKYRREFYKSKGLGEWIIIKLASLVKFLTNIGKGKKQ